MSRPATCRQQPQPFHDRVKKLAGPLAVLGGDFQDLIETELVEVQRPSP